MKGTPEPWTNICSASTTSLDETSKIKRPRRAGQKTVSAANPHRLAGLGRAGVPVTLTLTTRRSSELWMEVVSDEGRFFVAWDASVFALVDQVVKGGHLVERSSTSTLLAHRRGKEHLNRE